MNYLKIYLNLVSYSRFEDLIKISFISRYSSTCILMKFFQYFRFLLNYFTLTLYLICKKNRLQGSGGHNLKGLLVENYFKCYNIPLLRKHSFQNANILFSIIIV